MSVSEGEIIPPEQAPRGDRGKWLPGVCINPLGPLANPERKEMQELARSKSVEAIERLVALMRKSRSEAIQLAAISLLLDRAWGKPKQEVEVANHGRTLEDILRAIAAAREAEKAGTR